MLCVKNSAHSNYPPDHNILENSRTKQSKFEWLRNISISTFSSTKNKAPYFPCYSLSRLCSVSTSRKYTTRHWWWWKSVMHIFTLRYLPLQYMGFWGSLPCLFCHQVKKPQQFCAFWPGGNTYALMISSSLCSDSSSCLSLVREGLVRALLQNAEHTY